MEVPSPPITKLYGPILERYLGERSPFIRELEEGARMRNRLIHRTAAPVDAQAAIKYVRVVEAAILHAMRRLYPNDRLLQELQRRVPVAQARGT